MTDLYWQKRESEYNKYGMEPYLAKDIKITEDIEMRFGEALLRFTLITYPYTHVLGVDVVAYATTLLHHEIDADKFTKELIVSLVTTVGQYTDNKELIALAGEKEPMYPCDAFDEKYYRYNLDMLLPNLQIRPSQFLDTKAA